jgi:hypothetical protein
VNRGLKPNPDYDPLRDFKPINLTFKTDHVAVVRKDTLAELIAHMKGAGQVKPRLGRSRHHVPHDRRIVQSEAPALRTDLIAGHIDVMVDWLANSLSQFQAGTIRALAVIGTTRHLALPDVPTPKEMGGAARGVRSPLLIPRHHRRPLKPQGAVNPSGQGRRGPRRYRRRCHRIVPEGALGAHGLGHRAMGPHHPRCWHQHGRD